MRVDSIKNGFVIDHITAGNGMKIYDLLKLGELSCPVALMTNVKSAKMGVKDIIKIDADVKIDMDILGYVDPNVTIDIIKNEKLVEKKNVDLPEKLTNVIYCKNPRCISSTEQELPHIFKLTDKENRVYRCFYCEAKAK
jgi:aspartate carbamoyltransferase regulatory subunit